MSECLVRTHILEHLDVPYISYMNIIHTYTYTYTIYIVSRSACPCSVRQPPPSFQLSCYACTAAKGWTYCGGTEEGEGRLTYHLLVSYSMHIISLLPVCHHHAILHTSHLHTPYTLCAEAEYRSMVLDKTGGLFRLAIGLLQCFSTCPRTCPQTGTETETDFSPRTGAGTETGTGTEPDFTPLLDTLALYFQIRDDYLNLFGYVTYTVTSILYTSVVYYTLHATPRMLYCIHYIHTYTTILLFNTHILYTSHLTPISPSIFLGSPISYPRPPATT